MKHTILALAMTCAPVFVGAQASPALADCWVEDRHVYGSDEFDTADKSSALEKDIEAISAWLKKDPRLKALEGYRLQLNTFLGFPAGDAKGPNLAEIWVGLHGRDTWTEEGDCTVDQDRADYGLSGAVRILINGTSELDSVVQSPEDAPLRPFGMPEETGKNAGRPIYAHRLVLITPRGMAPFRPYLVRDQLEAAKERFREIAGFDGYGEKEVKAIEDHMAGAGRDDLDKQAAYAPVIKPENAIWGYGLVSSADALPKVYLAPELNRPKGSPMASRFMTVSLEINAEDADLRAALERWLAETDFSFLEGRLK